MTPASWKISRPWSDTLWTSAWRTDEMTDTRDAGKGAALPRLAPAARSALIGAHGFAWGRATGDAIASAIAWDANRRPAELPHDARPCRPVLLRHRAPSASSPARRAPVSRRPARPRVSPARPSL